MPESDKHTAGRIFQNGALIAGLDAFDDPKAAPARFTLSFAKLRPSACLSSWPSASPRRARKSGNSIGKAPLQLEIETVTAKQHSKQKQLQLEIENTKKFHHMY